jgi:DNA-binding MarR family transcriptional regulator
MQAREGELSPLEAHLGYWLRFVSNHVSDSFRRLVEANGVTVSEWVALRHLYREALAPGTLTEALGMTKGAISKVLARLEAKGLIARTTVAADRRAQRIALTSAGRKLVPRLARLADENDDAFFGHLSPGARAALVDAMKELVRVHGLREVPVE